MLLIAALHAYGTLQLLQLLEPKNSLRCLFLRPRRPLTLAVYSVRLFIGKTGAFTAPTPKHVCFWTLLWYNQYSVDIESGIYFSVQKKAGPQIHGRLDVWNEVFGWHGDILLAQNPTNQQTLRSWAGSVFLPEIMKNHWSRRAAASLSCFTWNNPPKRLENERQWEFKRIHEKLDTQWHKNNKHFSENSLENLFLAFLFFENQLPNVQCDKVPWGLANEYCGAFFGRQVPDNVVVIGSISTFKHIQTV